MKHHLVFSPLTMLPSRLRVASGIGLASISSLNIQKPNFFGQSEFQLRKAFVVFGNLEKTPFYAAFGRKTIDFGNFDGYNAFTQTESQHYYHAVSDQPVLELGYYNMYSGLKLSATAFSGGRQLRVGYAGAENENKIANFAASFEKEFPL